ncbi:hypothetical protein KC19_4G168000 [Ceratodon purpureus]|nr:hypothetical protein KC19_4G168000 [Ceratodon purpureus]KAG0580361.1 hypothetical protein KC19_4G168000 [Ceratodon purpureus]KAG0580362.1 hypothetical protein KC19_4G168000 [Ceratodon purpureus]KAG0580363.1 hypothetical protein KC19_4G168000 [Ceratodon purpureus]KAG0580365.1 hypothetical protein KC19_4G168000 [Ceratodon purpureus]
MDVEQHREPSDEGVQSDDGSENRALANMFEQTVSANATPVDGVATFDAVVDSALGVWVRLFVPTQLDGGSKESGSKSAETMPLVLYFHGGGFVALTPDVALYDQFCRRLAAHSHAVVVSVCYRLAPEHKFPAAYDDSFTALEWLNSEAAKSLLPPNVDLSRTFLCGDSAGGNIVHHLAVQVAESKDLGPNLKLAGLVLIQPFFGGEERTPAEVRMQNPAILSIDHCDFAWKAFLPPDATRDHPAAHVFGPHSKDLRNVAMPPALIIVGGLDILQDWEMRYAEGMKEAGKDVVVCFYEDGIHVFCLLDQTAPTADKMMLDVASFIATHSQFPTPTNPVASHSQFVIFR